MLIATWNINGLGARFDFLVHWLKARRPDVVGLQELKATADNVPVEALAELGYHAVVCGQKAWNGVAVLSREPIEKVQSGLPGEEEAGARLLRVKTAGLDFTTVYCPNGKDIDHLDYPRKLAWFDSLRDYFDGSLGADEPAVLCGDFNIAPTRLDTHDEERLAGGIHHTEAERARFRALLDLGFQDLFRELHPDTVKFSWWDYRFGAFHRNLGLRIDFLLATEAARKRVEEVETDRDYRKKKEGLIASDHAPVMARLRP
ncbi:MAG: exodeoxyribonuclease III [Holophagales bacterium]|nr:exodeoxyribonuclease III [Holophagales bacterium]MYG31306.1 exodeoxyribonuclease III [Holophagales bacterium]MYI78900.1 exodeoxyribonuclease III [Holophagales bacterium]